jgi:hypothetical protein
MSPQVPKAAMPAMSPDRSSLATEECLAAGGIESYFMLHERRQLR